MLELNFTPFPTLHTSRLILRQMSVLDLDDLFYLRSNEDVMKYIDRPKAQSPEEVSELIEKIANGVLANTAIAWAIALKEDNKLIGTVSYHEIIHAHYRAEIGYVLKPEFWGQGIVTDAVTRVLQYGFNDMRLHSVMAIVNPSHAASIRVLMKHGFVREGYFKEDFYYNGRFLDSEYYSLLGRNFVAPV